jgi:hypothetical protein
MRSNFDIWFTNIIFQRDKVTPFICGVSGARYKGFATHEQAAKFYLHAKENGLVSVVRDPGDEEFFGPLHDAMQ